MRKELFLPKTHMVDKNAKILELCKGKRVLDIGMGGYIDDDDKNNAYYEQDLLTTLHGQISQCTESLDGLDMNPKAIDLVSKTFNGQYFLEDLTKPGLETTIGKQYELIVLGDVIEHLDACQPALKNLGRLLAPGGQLIISTVNAYYIESLIKMLFRYESVHEEHTAYFSYITMRRLLSMNGFKVDEFMYYAKRMKKFDSLAHRIGYSAGQLFTHFFPQYAMGLLFVVSLEAAASDSESPSHTLHMVQQSA